MPRTGRVILPGHPHHVVQRGHDRQVVFATAGDAKRYLGDLRELKESLGVRVYAWCLMTNHVHLLLQPSDTRGLGMLMKALAARMTRYRNRLGRRSGTLWESRYKSSLVDTDSYLLACSRYIELNPVRARIVASPGTYRWSSYAARLGQAVDAVGLDLDPCYEALGADETARRLRYAAFVASGVPEPEMALIRNAVQRGQLTGSSRFVAQIEAAIGRRVESRGPGRPKKIRE